MRNKDVSRSASACIYGESKYRHKNLQIRNNFFEKITMKFPLFQL